MKTVWTHANLCRDLAEHLIGQGYMTWIEVRRVGVQSYGDAGRIDVVALTPWVGRTKFDMIAFEVKVSRSDLQRDLMAGKWRRYATEYGIQRVAFACAEGIATAADMPADAGLWVREESGWKRKSAPRALVNDQRKLDPLLLLSMLSERKVQIRPQRGFGELIDYLPNEVWKAIKQTPDRWFRDHLARRAASEVGAEFSRRLNRKDETKVNEWALRMIDWLAPLCEETPEELMRQAVRGDEFQPPWKLQQALRRGSVLAQRAEIIQQLAQHLSTLAYGYGEADPEHDRRVLDAIREAQDRKPRTARKKAS